MKNADQPIYPQTREEAVHFAGCNPTIGIASYMGLTKREYFAAHAPEVPDWFEHKTAPFPKEPKSWIDMAPDDPFKEEARQWYQDRSYDIASEELQWFQQAWENFWEERHIWNKQDKANRYFQWRYYYADMMLKEPEKEE